MSQNKEIKSSATMAFKSSLAAYDSLFSQILWCLVYPFHLCIFFKVLIFEIMTVRQ